MALEEGDEEPGFCGPQLSPGVPLSRDGATDLEHGTEAVKQWDKLRNVLPWPRHYEEWCVPVPCSSPLPYNTGCATKTASDRVL